MTTNQLPTAVAAARRLRLACKRARQAANRDAVRIDRRDPVSDECDEAREVERYMEGAESPEVVL